MATIQWFPGHMSKARRQVQENLKYVDIVFELVDARLPISSRNPMLGKIIGDKPRLMILNKKDLADEKLSIEWQNYFRQEGLNSLLIDSKEQATVKKVTAAAKNVLADKIARDKERGIQERAIRVMVIGIPNVGKSTLLNRLAGKKAAQVGNRPGVTKGQQWIRSNKDLEILDTPGILWPKFEDQLVGLKLALTGAIKDDLIPKDEITIYGLEYFMTNYPNEVVKRYKLMDADMELSAVDLIIYLTKKLGFKDDYDRFYDLFIKDVRDGKLGKFTLDRVIDFESEDEEVK
ncbi:ribosome biogenesis GTPase YlqF [Floricoccus tropicus]|uniref:Ribosome biogenesis GTPase A n=1 Tax=Floricoccus tropicus TaxID=1859473 RepID=A0A1E8GPT5_9LACT|nr:ribosome biogenesis GTPase YlqF [Floricoccus tropicus]OFI50261.1 ribosome biogenesis GTPase YlqF [Floricoccus tropicus]